MARKTKNIKTVCHNIESLTETYTNAFIYMLKANLNKFNLSDDNREVVLQEVQKYFK